MFGSLRSFQGEEDIMEQATIKEPAKAATEEPAKAATMEPAKADTKEPAKADAKAPAKAAAKKPAKAGARKPSKAQKRKHILKRYFKKKIPSKVVKKFNKVAKIMEEKKSVKAGRIRYGSKKLKPNAYYVKPIAGKTEGTQLVPVKKSPAYYAAQLKEKKRPKRVKISKRPVRSSLTPGTVCIVLAGLHKGKRVVFLKGLPGGLCLITGPHKVNSCPMRRVNQIYLIATSLKIDISWFGIPKHVNDRYFRRVKAPRPRKKEGDIFEKKKEAYFPSDQRKKDQAVVDGNVISAIRRRPDKKMVFGYLGTMFALRKGMYPHRLKF
ncbi:hypothetical protein Pmani_023224 [Petrolisthes manimaculis]|uniref:Large ribosomal subunit protein eL6 n=1 Tax=Petrolisthes manimaculis TaxID=1843537 RepID=A0AAE1PB49_9EUCA|nr:hypothetical protein Pmani_023224 [Petrolisthes manimaculis]